MAYLIPENIASRGDVPEPLQVVARALRDFVEDDVTVWLETEPAFSLTVLDPKAGLVLIGAAAAGARSIRRSGGFLGWLRGQRLELAPDQSWTERAASFSATLAVDRRLTVPIATRAVVGLPDLSVSDARGQGLTEDDLKDVLIREDFESGALRQALQRVLGGAPAARLSEVDERIARATVRPEIVISRHTGPDATHAGQLVFALPEHDDPIRVLDRDQERLAHHMAGGYRVIRGVAGSGKTLVLTFRARHLARAQPTKRFLITCYNVVLSKALELEFADVPNVEVRTIDSLAAKYSQLRGRNESPDDWRRQREDAARHLKTRGRLDRFDAVFVDEAQDLDPAGLDLAYAALGEGCEDFIVALDGAQNVYRRNARWNPPGMTARGRTTLLKRCYRNTREIAEFAWRFLQSAQLAELSDDDADDPTLIIPPELTERRGPTPEVLQCADARAEVDEIVRRMKVAHGRGVPWGQMVVLYGNAKPWQFTLYARLTEEGIPYHWSSMNAQSKRETIGKGDVVRAATFQSLKGVEFSRVFMCGVNDIYDPGGEDEGTRRKLAYVAMTRAMDELVVTVSGGGPIGQALQEANRRPEQPAELGRWNGTKRKAPEPDGSSPLPDSQPPSRPRRARPRVSK